jgi:hypothetical protein
LWIQLEIWSAWTASVPHIYDGSMHLTAAGHRFYSSWIGGALATALAAD